jgi:hypothetical protein
MKGRRGTEESEEGGGVEERSMGRRFEIQIVVPTLRSHPPPADCVTVVGLDNAAPSP